VVHVTVALALPPVAAAEPGASGGLVTFNAAVAADGSELPIAFRATTLKV
jgi:hypothetical protein